VKVLIATPSYDGKRYCFSQYVQSLNAIDYLVENVKFLMVDNTILKGNPYDKISIKFDSEIIRLYGKSRQLNSREVLAYCYSVIFCYAEAYNFDYLLILEADVLLPSNGLSRLIETARTHSGLIAPVSFRANGEHLQIYHDDMTLWKTKGSDGLYRITRTPYKIDEITEPIFRIGSATFSCVLIPFDYVKILKSVWYSNHYNHPDGFFYQRAKDLGIPVWCNSAVRCKHLQRSFAGNVIW